jgi:hypothetical protein
MPEHGDCALDIGARDGYLSKMLSNRFAKVVALDLEMPVIDHPGIECVRGNATQLQFGDDTFDLVLCAEVLEHIPREQLAQVSKEIVRVARNTVVIGVPFRQDIRLGRTKCASCGTMNPPWGHINSFREEDLVRLFGAIRLVDVSFIGETRDVTNRLSTALLDFAGNPYGTYSQDEGCIACSARLVQPAPTARTAAQRIATRAAIVLNRIQQLWSRPHGNWIHMRFEKATSRVATNTSLP